MNHNDKQGIEKVTVEGLVTIRMFDGTTIQTTRRLALEVDVNGLQTSQVVSCLPIEQWCDFTEPYGMVDSGHPLIREFIDRVLDVIAAPSLNGQDQCFKVPAKEEPQAAD